MTVASVWGRREKPAVSGSPSLENYWRNFTGWTRGGSAEKFEAMVHLKSDVGNILPNLKNKIHAIMPFFVK